MAKLMNMFLILIAIQASLLIYTNQTPADTALWTFITNMSQWNSATFVLAFVGIAAGIGLVGVAASSIFGYKTDFLIFAGAIAGFISIGVIFTNLAGVIRDELMSRVFYGVCELENCAPADLLVAITIGPIALLYVWTIIEWWRGKDY